MTLGILSNSSRLLLLLFVQPADGVLAGSDSTYMYLIP
jgi:hypothetical protein